MSIDSVLVTGSSGTIGTALCGRLLDDGYEVFGTDLISNPWNDEIDKRTTIADLRNEDELKHLPTDIDLIIHLGAHARVHHLVKQPELALENLEMTFNVLNFARKHDVSNVIFSSSREVYGNVDRVIYDEQVTYTDNSESPYTASKIGGEAMVKSFGQCYGMSTVILRFSNVYGRYDVSNRVVPLFIARCHQERELTVYGAEKVLDFTYLDDCVDGVCRVINQYSKAKGTTFNIASGRGFSLRELAETINELTPGTSEITVEPSRTGEVNRFIADISKAQKMLGYQPTHSFREGVGRTIGWYLDRPELLEQVTASRMNE